MTLCDYDNQSFFKWIFEPRDFNWGGRRGNAVGGGGSNARTQVSQAQLNATSQSDTTVQTTRASGGGASSTGVGIVSQSTGGGSSGSTGGYELPEALQVVYDPVGFFYFHKDVVYAILGEIKQINKRRMDLRDLLSAMDRIWRTNNQQHRVLNEADWSNKDDVARRVNELVFLTRRKLYLEERAENLVTGDIIKYWEYMIPNMYPTLPNERQTAQSTALAPTRTPYIDAGFTPLPYANPNHLNKKVYIGSSRRL
jgi:hypothetical protein